MQEEYKIVNDFEDYEVSNYGNVRKVSTGEELRQSVYKEYLRVDLFKNFGRYDMVQKTIDVHRLVALSFIPNPLNKRIVDHIDKDKLNNHIENLRWATHSENGMNRSAPKNNSSGQTGVYYNKTSKKWRAELKRNGKKISLGSYVKFEDAVRARLEGEQEYFGEFQSHQDITAHLRTCRNSHTFLKLMGRFTQD